MRSETSVEVSDLTANLTVSETVTRTMVHNQIISLTSRARSFLFIFLSVCCCVFASKQATMLERAIHPRERMNGQPGIITQRRQPHHWPGNTARKPLVREFQVKQTPIESDHWERAVMRQHRRWDAKTGTKLREAEEAAIRAEPVGFDDELDQLVRIQVERQRRLRSMRSAPPVVQRLLHPPPPPPKALDPLDEFMQFVNQGGAQNANARDATRAFVPPKQPGVNVPHTRLGAFAGPMNPTRTGLYHAVQDG
jgi:hypothetical protein